MKVLYCNYFEKADYLNDSIYHGLMDNGAEIYTLSNPRHMLKSTKPEEISHVGNRFSLFFKLEKEPIFNLSGNELFEKIISNFFDFYVIPIRDFDNFYWTDRNLIKSVFKKEQVHFIDGKDDTFLMKGLEEDGMSWKRELIYEEANPISFSIPESQLIQKIPVKDKILAHIIPGDISTYIFDNEESYYADYARSYYAMTTKKAGWDCFRHYEILANRCIPYFPGIDNCPERTMANFPKRIIKETNKYAERGEIHPNYNEICEELFEYTKNNLTTKAVVKKMLNL